MIYKTFLNTINEVENDNFELNIRLQEENKSIYVTLQQCKTKQEDGYKSVVFIPSQDLYIKIKLLDFTRNTQKIKDQAFQFYNIMSNNKEALKDAIINKDLNTIKTIFKI